MALTGACLAAFAVTIPLPRVDGQLIGSDGLRYYLYLPSVLIDGDLDFADEYTYYYRHQPAAAEHLAADRTPTGLPANRLGIGPALLWSPFFLAAHLLAHLLQALGLGVATDGYGYFYQAPVLAGSILYGGLGAWFCLRAARRAAGEKAATFATLLTVLAGNPLYYLTVEPSMPHALSMFASGAFFLLWLTSRERPGGPAWTGLGGLAGLMALIRPQDGLFLALPIADGALSAWRGREAGRRVGWLRGCLAAAGTAVLTFVPQLVVWKVLNGGFLRSGYARERDVLFHWSPSGFFDVLFSAQRGLFVWHPVFLLAIVGLARVARRERRLAGLCFLGLAIQWVVIAGWHDRAQGDAFGSRMFIVCTPIFVFGAAALADRAARRWPWRALVAAGVALVLLNVLLVVQYRLELLALERPPTYLDLTLGRFRLLA